MAIDIADLLEKCWCATDSARSAGTPFTQNPGRLRPVDDGVHREPPCDDLASGLASPSGTLDAGSPSLALNAFGIAVTATFQVARRGPIRAALVIETSAA